MVWHLDIHGLAYNTTKNCSKTKSSVEIRWPNHILKLSVHNPPTKRLEVRSIRPKIHVFPLITSTPSCGNPAV